MQTIVYVISMLRRWKRDTPKKRRSIKARRNERELLFWTVREVLALGRQLFRFLLLAALIIYANRRRFLRLEPR